MAKKEKEKNAEGKDNFSAGDELKQFEDKIEKELTPQTVILERINNNLENISQSFKFYRNTARVHATSFT